MLLIYYASVLFAESLLSRVDDTYKSMRSRWLIVTDITLPLGKRCEHVHTHPYIRVASRDSAVVSIFHEVELHLGCT